MLISLARVQPSASLRPCCAQVLHKCIAAIGCLLLSISFSPLVFAAPLPAPPQLSATSMLLLDYDSGKIIAEKNATERIEPASLTKMMTAYIVSAELERGSISVQDDVVISAHAQSMPGSRMFIEAGKTAKLSALLKGLIIQSGNDASVALAEHIAASEAGFVGMMNQMSTALGMTSTHFANSSGLPDPEHYTSAADLAILARALIRDYPQEYELYSVKEYEYNGIPQLNRNKLLWRDDSVDGIKTGHTEAAGYCLVASAERDGMRLISVVLGTGSEKTRSAESQQLLNYGFRFFRTARVYAAGETVEEARIWMGREQSIPLGVADDLFVTLPRDEFDSLSSQIELSEYIRAPARIGQQFGRSVLKSGDKVVGEVPLLALRKVEEGNIFRRMTDSVMRHFK